MEDDIAGNEKNPEDNIVRVEKDGENVYSNVIVDYHISELTPSDVLNFLSADENTNVFLFWSGHGLPGGMCWNEEDYGLTADIINGFLRDLAERGKFRQLLCCIESCFAGSIFQEITDIPGALFITAANAFETSKADNYDDVLGIWRSNRFTVTLRQQLTDNPDCSVYDLYQRLFINTIGSHVMVYNQHSFGSLKTTLCNEFTNQNN